MRLEDGRTGGRGSSRGRKPPGPFGGPPCMVKGGGGRPGEQDKIKLAFRETNVIIWRVVAPMLMGEKRQR